MTAPLGRHGQHVDSERCNHCGTPADMRRYREWVVHRVTDRPPVHVGLRAEQCPQLYPHEIGGDAA